MSGIVVPLDGSELCQEILPYVRTLASTLAEPVHLLRAIPDAPGEEIRLKAEGYLESIATRLREDGLEVTTEVAFHSPPVAIVDAATQRQATLIAMATHGYSGLRRWALGSVTDEVVHTTTVPIFVIRPEAESAGADKESPQASLKRLLVALDGSELAKKALPIATRLATQTQGNLHLLRAVLPIEAFYDDLQPVPVPKMQVEEDMQREREDAQEFLEQTAEPLRQSGLTVESIVMSGKAEDVIIEEANRLECDVIVMATHGYGGLERWLLGSVADKVLHATSLPLILVHAKHHEA